MTTGILRAPDLTGAFTGGAYRQICQMCEGGGDTLAPFLEWRKNAYTQLILSVLGELVQRANVVSGDVTEVALRAAEINGATQVLAVLQDPTVLVQDTLLQKELQELQTSLRRTYGSELTVADLNPAPGAEEE